MEESRFDALTRQVGSASTRRSTMRAALGAVAASTVAAVGLAKLGGESEAARNNNNNNRNGGRRRCRRCRQQLRQLQCRPLRLGSRCVDNEDCCPNATNNICALATGGTQNVCCKGTGASCSFNSDCCKHFNCQGGQCRMQ